MLMAKASCRSTRFCKAWSGNELGPRVATKEVVDSILLEASEAGPSIAYTPRVGWLEYTGLEGVFAPASLRGFAPPSAAPAVQRPSATTTRAVR